MALIIASLSSLVKQLGNSFCLYLLVIGINKLKLSFNIPLSFKYKNIDFKFQ